MSTVVGADGPTVPSNPEVSLPSGFIRAVGAASDEEQMLKATAEWLPRIIAVERVSVALPISATHMEIYAFGGTSDVVRNEHEIAIGSSMIGHSYSERRMVLVDDLPAAPYDELKPLIKAGLRSAVVAPLISGGRCLGTVNLASDQPSFFTETHSELLRTVGELIAGTLNLIQMAAREKIRAMTDDLTGSLNRGAVLDKLDRQFEGGGACPSLLYLDLDGFKLINDIHGHHVGDEVLRILAGRIKSKLRDGETLGRLGGDEFLIVVNEDNYASRATELAERILDVCEDPIVIRRLKINPALSIGVAGPRPQQSSEVSKAVELLADADRAMYRAKRSGSRMVVADEEIRRKTAMLTVIDRDLDRALAERSIVFHYQPVCDLASGDIVGAEALIRWRHPEYGAIPAPLLIGRIEATGRVSSFTRWCLDTVARDLTTIRQAVPAFADGRVSFNLSPLQLAMSNCADLVLTTCRRYGLEPRDLPVEVVESSEIRPGDEAETNLRKLSDAGSVIALDDFGTGHNALGYFTRFPIHVIKFDRSLVGVMTESREAFKILKAMAAMSRDLGIMSLAEGIEHQEEMDACHQLGIHYGQGWHLGRPKPLDELITILQETPSLVVASP